MGYLKDDVIHLRKNLSCINKDVENLTESISFCRCERNKLLCILGTLHDLQTHLKEIDKHIEDVLAHVIHKKTKSVKT